MKRTLPTWCKEVKKSMIDDDINMTELAERVGMCRNYVYYMVNDITELLGISRSKAYEMIRTMRKECIASGKLTKAYPSGRIPKKYFNEHCMIE